MKRGLTLLMAVCLMAGVAHADVVRLKNGNTVDGKIVEKTSDGVKIDIGGVTLTYYTDEIDAVEADEVPVSAVEPVAQVPVVEPVIETPAPVEPKVDVPVVVEPEVRASAADEPKIEAPAVAVEPEAADAPASDDLDGLTKNDLIKKFVQIYGVKENMQANFDQMTSTLKPEQAEAFRQSVKVDEIVQLLLPIYDKHFSADDLRAYIRFYASAEGKKLVRALPLLMKDSVDVSMTYLDAHLPESLKQEQSSAGD